MAITHSTDDPGRASELADYLEANKARLLKEWLARARGDPAVLSDALTQVELVDHVPGIIDAVVDALRNRNRASADEVQEITARHTVVRWVQDYDLRAVLREVSLLRTAFIRQLLAFDEQASGLGGESRLLNTSTIHRILDDIVMDATDTFLKLERRADRDAT